MTYTEKEARNKSCPLQHQRCLCGDCILWKWDTSPDAARLKNAQYNANLEATGHCGLIKKGA